MCHNMVVDIHSFKIYWCGNCLIYTVVTSTVVDKEKLPDSKGQDRWNL